MIPRRAKVFANILRAIQDEAIARTELSLSGMG